MAEVSRACGLSSLGEKTLAMIVTMVGPSFKLLNHLFHGNSRIGHE